jgi:hypothetical protein
MTTNVARIACRNCWSRGELFGLFIISAANNHLLNFKTSLGRLEPSTPFYGPFYWFPV